MWDRGSRGPEGLAKSREQSDLGSSALSLLRVSEPMNHIVQIRVFGEIETEPIF
jgi:hypothetical protein